MKIFPEPDEKFAFRSGFTLKSRTRAFLLAFILDPQVPFQNEPKQGARRFEYIDDLEGALLL